MALKLKFWMTTRKCRKKSRSNFAALASAAYAKPNKQGGNNQPQQTFDEEKQKSRHAEAFNPFMEKTRLVLVFVFLHFYLKITFLLAVFKLSVYKFVQL